MSTLLQPIKSLAGEFGLFLSKRRDLELLNRLDDRILADISISRELLDQGLKDWPWRVPKESEAVFDTEQGIHAAVRELENYSDAELADLGISRGSITEAVLHGRPGIDRPVNDNTIAAAA